MRLTLAVAVACTLLACSPEEEAAVPDSATSRVDVAFKTSEIALPEGSDVVQVAEGKGTTVVATTTGLFSVAGESLERVTGRGVRAVTYVDGVGFVFATEDSIEIWDGAFVRPSLLAIEPRTIRALASRGAELFVLGQDEIFVVAEGRVVAVRDLPGVLAIAVSASGIVVAQRARGGVMLERRDGAWQRQDVEEDLLHVGVSSEGRLVGVREADRTLVERVSDGGRVEFRPAATDVDALYTDSASMWVARPGALEIVKGTVVASGERPANLGTAAWPVAGAALWVRGERKLQRIQAEAARISWAAAVKPIYARHCERCHRSGGVARYPLATAADWRIGGDAIISAIEEERMPRDGATTVTAAELDLVRQWRTTGTAE
jgi:hypothetical protein